MAKNTEFVSFKKSNVKIEGKPKLPSPSSLVEGEIAINFAEGVETLSIKNESGNVVTFSSDNYYNEQKLGSAFTGVNSAVTVTEYIEENELVISTSLTDLDERKLDASAYTPTEELWISGTGLNSVVMKGGENTASGEYSIAEGHYVLASGDDGAHAEGNGTRAIGRASHAEGLYTSATSEASHAEGERTYASGTNSHAEGINTKANGNYSHAEGNGSSANSESSHAEGYNTLSSGRNSHAEGAGSKATKENAHAEGHATLASGYETHAEGYITSAMSNYAHTEGYSTIATNQSEHASGQHNVSNSASTTFGHSGNTLFSVGNGSPSVNHNAFEIRQNGDIYIVNKNGQDVKLQDEIGNITIDQVIDSGTSASTDAVSTSAVYGFVTSYTPSITVDQVLDNTTSASTNPVSTKAVYDAVTDNELVWTNAFVTLSGTVSAHTEDTNIHLTSTEKGQLHTHSNKSALDAITGNVGTMAYENANSYSSATQVSSALQGKSNSNHNQGANTITAMTGYVTSSTVSDISTSDTLNGAMAKLEARFGGIRIVTISQTDYNSLPTPRDSSILYIITD